VRVAQREQIALLHAHGRSHDHSLSAHHLPLLRPVDAQFFQRQIDIG